MKEFTTLIPEKLDFVAKNALKKEGIKVIENPKLNREEVLNLIPQMDALIIRNETSVDKELIAKAEKLKIVVRAGSGYDNVDLALCKKNKIIVCNVPEGNIMSAAELTIGLIIAATRKITYAHEYTKAGNWDRPMFKGVELYKKTLGIIGLGKVGLLVAKRAKAFGMEVIAYDPYIPDFPFMLNEVKRKDKLSLLLRESDIITIHTPKTFETDKMITKNEINIMKDGVYLINAARGGLFSEKSLIQGLKSKKIAGLAIDTWEVEPQTRNELYKYPNVVISPHLGATTIEAQKRVAVEGAKRVIALYKKRVIKNVLN